MTKNSGNTTKKFKDRYVLGEGYPLVGRRNVMLCRRSKYELVIFKWYKELTGGGQIPDYRLVLERVKKK
jgi:hypothetical protein